MISYDAIEEGGVYIKWIGMNYAGSMPKKIIVYFFHFSMQHATKAQDCVSYHSINTMPNI